MKITCVIPTRGDRPELLEQAHRQIERQIRKPDDVIEINREASVSENVRAGYEQVTEGIVTIWEDDDLYPDIYLRSVENYWEMYDDNSLEILGWSESIYYHLGVRRYRIQSHDGRSSLMQTTIKAGLNIEWPTLERDQRFLDIYLWERLNGRTVPGWMAIGIKHGLGLCGGKGHLSNFYRKDDSFDPELKFLFSFTSDNFYRQLSERLQ